MIGVGHTLNLVTSVALAQIKALLNEGTDTRSARGAGRLRAATGAVVYWSVGAIKIC
jgi:hypothetical protein